MNSNPIYFHIFEIVYFNIFEIVYFNIFEIVYKNLNLKRTLKIVKNKREFWVQKENENPNCKRRAGCVAFKHQF